MDADPAPETTGEPDPIVWASVIDKLDAMMRERLTGWGKEVR